MKDIVVILDNIRSTFNVGSVFRTSDGAGVKKIYLGGITPGGDHVKVKKTALGAENYVDWEHIKDVKDIIFKLKGEGYQIISVEQTPNSKNYKETEISDKAAFIFGNEISGVSPELIELSDLVLELPMRGKKNSLNVSTTAGIILYNYA